VTGAPGPGPGTLDAPLDTPGRHVGALRIPWSHDESAYGQVVVPVVVLHGAPGPTALLTAGVHGDEPEGSIALLRLSRELDPARLHGRVILVPAVNLPAARAGRRTSPIDSGNLARLFPGDPAGGVTSQIAEAVTRLLLPAADLVLDLHSGGRTMEYLPCAWGRLPEDRSTAERVLDALLAFGAPLTAVVARPEARGTLVATALQAGKIATAAEIGGGGAATPDTVAIALLGARRVLAQAGILRDPDRGTPESRLLVVEKHHFLRSPGRGLFEPALRLGGSVEAGALAGWLHDVERPDRPPEPVRSEAGGLVLCRRVPAVVETGDVLFHLAADTDRETLLRLAG
jgi:predicted deacylase